jgi:4-amino-4-deoxychorismate lyase
MYGDGFFTTMLSYQQRITNWIAHWQRLQTSAQRLGFPALNEQHILSQLAPALSAIAVKEEWAVIKLVVTRGHQVKGVGYAPPSGLTHQELNYMVFLSPAPTRSQPLSSGLKTILCQTPASSNPVLAGIKHLNRLDNVLARAEVVRAGVDEGVMLDADGLLVSGTQSNVVLVRGKCLITPQLDRSGVAGTCLASLPQALKQAGLDYQWQQRQVRLAELEQVDAAFMCNAVRGVQAVQRFQNSELNPKLIHPIHQAWLKYVLKSEYV